MYLCFGKQEYSSFDLPGTPVGACFPHDSGSLALFAAAFHDRQLAYEKKRIKKAEKIVFFMFDSVIENSCGACFVVCRCEASSAIGTRDYQM